MRAFDDARDFLEVNRLATSNDEAESAAPMCSQEALMRALSIVTMCLVLTACDNEPGAGKTAAEVSAPVAAPATATAPDGAATYAFSQDGSTLAFVGAKITGKHDGSFKVFSGTITVPGGDVTKGTVALEVDTSSVVTDSEKLTAHLKSPDFFDVAKFSKATFTSTSVVADPSKGGTHVITGNLDLHGVAKSISFPATVRLTATGVEADAEFAINRKDFSIVYAGMPDDLIKDDVLMKITLRATPGAKPAG
jgi:polyisoprenoid-binding protein YceI